MKKTGMNKRLVIYVLRLVLYYACQPTQAGLQPRRPGDASGPGEITIGFTSRLRSLDSSLRWNDNRVGMGK